MQELLKWLSDNVFGVLGLLLSIGAVFIAFIKKSAVSEVKEGELQKALTELGSQYMKQAEKISKQESKMIKQDERIIILEQHILRQSDFNSTTQHDLEELSKSMRDLTTAINEKLIPVVYEMRGQFDGRRGNK
jgi:L-arabinose isomerase